MFFILKRKFCFIRERNFHGYYAQHLNLFLNVRYNVVYLWLSYAAAAYKTVQMVDSVKKMSKKSRQQ